MRESRTYGSVRAKAEWLSYSTTIRGPSICSIHMETQPGRLGQVG